MKQEFFLMISNFHYLVLSVIIGTFALKLCLFLKFKKPKWKYYNIVYFKMVQVASAQSNFGINIKIIQNSLSLYAAFLILVEVLVSVLNHG